MSDTMIAFNNVSKRYPGNSDALSQVSFELARGEMAFVTGHSGAGKSSLLQLISLIERPSYGKIVVDDQNYQTVTKKAIPRIRRQMGIIFQSPMLLEDRTIFDNVALPLVIAGYSKQDIQRRTRAALDKVGLLRKEKMYPLMLSGGEQQRVGIARAVVHKPKLLLADEPTGNLDPKLSAEIMHLFEAFHQVGVSVLIASHDLSLIASMQHRILTLRDGKLVSDG